MEMFFKELYWKYLFKHLHLFLNQNIMNKNWRLILMIPIGVIVYIIVYYITNFSLIIPTYLFFNGNFESNSVGFLNTLIVTGCSFYTSLVAVALISPLEEKKTLILLLVIFILILLLSVMGYFINYTLRNVGETLGLIIAYIITIKKLKEGETN